jgi:Zn-dependent membrane protease YugP
MYFNSLYLWFALPGLLIGIWAQIKLSSAYGKYSRVPVDSGMTGAQAAREILNQASLNSVPVQEVPGHLTDHYDPAKRAKEQLFRLGLVHESERAGVSRVLDAAALTYVAALVSGILTLLYYLTLARDSRR